MSITWKQCARCQQPKPNVGPWSEGEFAGKDLCGTCKVQLALERPGARARMEAAIRTAVAEVEVVIIPLTEKPTSSTDAVRALRDMHAENPAPGIYLGSAAGARFYNLPHRGGSVFAAFLSLPGFAVPTVGTHSSLVELAARAAFRALPAGIDRLAKYIEVIDLSTRRALVVKDEKGGTRLLPRSQEPGLH